jgi:hypothetical protein
MGALPGHPRDAHLDILIIYPDETTREMYYPPGWPLPRQMEGWHDDINDAAVIEHTCWTFTKLDENDENSIQYPRYNIYLADGNCEEALGIIDNVDSDIRTGDDDIKIGGH